MNKLYEHVGKVLDTDTYIGAMDKVEQGIKQLTNRATARFKLFQEMPQDGRGFREWSQLVVEQANRCDWRQYDQSKAARDTILFQMEDKKLRRKKMLIPSLTMVLENKLLKERKLLGIKMMPDPIHESP